MLNEMTSQGYSAATVLSRLGGEHYAAVTAVEPGFWEGLGVDPAPELPLSMVVGIDYSGGSITENECYYYLSIPVQVTLTVGDTLLVRTGTGTLQGSQTDATLEVALPAPAQGDASTVTVNLSATVYPSQISGELSAPTTGAPEAAFTGTRP